MSADSTKPHKAPWVVRQLGGTAIVGGMGAATGLAYSAFKGGTLIKGAKGGAVLGVLCSIGFGGMVYDSFFGPKLTKAQQAKENLKVLGLEGELLDKALQKTYLQKLQEARASETSNALQR